MILNPRALLNKWELSWNELIWFPKTRKKTTFVITYSMFRTLVTRIECQIGCINRTIVAGYWWTLSTNYWGKALLVSAKTRFNTNRTSARNLTDDFFFACSMATVFNESASLPFVLFFIFCLYIDFELSNSRPFSCNVHSFCLLCDRLYWFWNWKLVYHSSMRFNNMFVLLLLFFFYFEVLIQFHCCTYIIKLYWKYLVHGGT